MKDQLKIIETLFLADDKSLHAIMDASPTMLWYTEKNRTVYLNRAWLAFTGKTLEKECGKGWFDGVHPEDKAMCGEIIQSAFHNEVTYEVRYRLLHNSGTYRWVQEQGMPIISPEGTLKGYVGECRDIDNEKKIEIKLSASEERYRRLFETSRDGILILDSESGKITDVNPFLEQLLGYSKSELLGKKLWEVGAFKNATASKETFKILQDIGFVRHTGLPLETKDGRLISAEFISNAYMTSEGRVMQCSIRIKHRVQHQKDETTDAEYMLLLEQGTTPPVNNDTPKKDTVQYLGADNRRKVDGRRKIEDQLKSSEERYRRLFETARDGILILDSETGEITEVNPFLEQLLGYSKSEFLGKKLWEVGAFRNAKASKETFKQLQDEGFVRYDDLPLETKDGRLIAVEFVSNAYMAGIERVMQCNVRDISERKRIEATDRALLFIEQEKLKTAFIADVTHELRTPLAIIKGNVELALRDKNKGASHEETFNAINLEINHLGEMLLDLAILTTEHQNFHKKIRTNTINLSDLITHVVKRLQMIALPKNIMIRLDVVPKVMVFADESYLEKLFSNVISNAIFYGKTTAAVTLVEEKDKNQVLITVTDDGIGITEKDIPRIFDRFFRTDIARSVNHEGTGLGLAISKWIVNAHRGEITVASTLNKGATFTIKLPIL